MRNSSESIQRAADFSLALLGLILFSPVWVIILIAIFLEDQTPLFFTQVRLGKDRKVFRIVKFRTMQNKKVTFIGRWLRQTGLDETIQIVNILKGDMSIVGARPLTQEDATRLGWLGEPVLPRWNRRPGVTGLAQLYSGRGKRASRYLEEYYANNHSICLDIKIIILSFAINLLGKRRVQKVIRKRK